MHEEHAMAFQAWYLDSEQLLPIGGIPYSNLIDGSSGKYLGETMRECDIIYSLMMTGVSELGVKGVGIYPVYIWLASATEEMGLIGSQRDRTNWAHQFGLLQKLHVLDWYFS